MQRLREVANRLRAPALSFAFGTWAHLYAAAEQAARVAAQIQSQRMHAEHLQAQHGSLEALIERLRGEYEQRLVAAEEEKRRALEQQLVELTGSAEQRAALAEERAREERIELLRRQTLRRMMNKDLASAWTAWHELWSARVYSLERLRVAANRLRAPALSSAFAFWARHCQRVRQAVSQAEAEAKSKALSEQERRRDPAPHRVHTASFLRAPSRTLCTTRRGAAPFPF